MPAHRVPQSSIDTEVVGLPPQVKHVLRGLWLLWLLAVVIGSLVPGTSPVIDALSRLQLSDKIQHLLAYAMLVFLPAVHERRAVAISAWIGVIALGVGLEFVQLWLGGREFEVNDMFADAVGASFGAVLGLSFGRRVLALVEQYAKKVSLR